MVSDALNTLSVWFNRYGKLNEDIDYYFNIPNANILSDDVFAEINPVLPFKLILLPPNLL